MFLSGVSGAGDSGTYPGGKRSVLFADTGAIGFFLDRFLGRFDFLSGSELLAVEEGSLVSPLASCWGISMISLQCGQ